VTPRLTFPDRRIDAVRGAVAVERGPLVYCFEQADQPAGLSVEDLALSPGGGLRERAATLPGIGPTVVVEAAAVRLPARAGSGLPYLPEPDTATAGTPAPAVAIPYFQWDNRDGRAMRIWMPRDQPDSPATS
ncbi:MAG TPA: glycoside hydrolase family 127 protein, partial [Streptosporangiaceae bacterium]|nr:glycoside hydrolase family 127 protein [Streptosporangiaceae bacterium]